MGYHGALSKGCQNCRRRKIKCDQQKPSCLKCQKSGVQCSGYRDLQAQVFRDETNRIIRKAKPPVTRRYGHSESSNSITPGVSISHARSWDTLPSVMTRSLCQPMSELAATFFFRNYALHQPPFGDACQDWLAKLYLDIRGQDYMIPAAIEAVGMAGIANISHDDRIATKSKQRYTRALAAMNQCLQDPVQAGSDTTLMGVILFGLYEVVNLDKQDKFRYWSCHVEAASALLQLRGVQQFDTDRGGQLYTQIRSEILSDCILQDSLVPPALVQATLDFSTSGLLQSWRDRKLANSASICEISFRLINLKAAYKHGHINDKEKIRSMAMNIDNDLVAWQECLPDAWRTVLTTAPEGDKDKYFEGKTHIIANHWIASAWNNWRVMRIFVHKIILQNEENDKHLETELKVKARSVIRQESIDLCISTASFSGHCRIFTLIRPLYVVAHEKLNPPNVRSFALTQLRRIEETTGVRQAGLLAEMAENSISICT